MAPSRSVLLAFCLPAASTSTSVAMMTCSDVKAAYKSQACCGNPSMNMSSAMLQKKQVNAVGAFMCDDPAYDIANVIFHPDFPPKEFVDIGYVKGLGFTGNRNASYYQKISDWFTNVFAQKNYTPMSLSDREKTMYKWSARDYVANFRAGNVTAVEYTTALVKRMMYYQVLNAFMVTSYILSSKIVDAAKAIDAKATSNGVESVAPLYGLPVPAKGTMATTDFPSSAGVGILDGCYAVEDADFIKLIKANNGIVMGKTNVPEFASSVQTLNHLNGATRNPHNFSFFVAGSSGGSAAAVAAYIAPIAVSEDTGGSTRGPANACGIFGYDPPRNKWPNDGNPGITHYRDQLGMQARSFDDILWFDKIMTNQSAAHAAAEAKVAALPASNITVGFPDEIFVTLNIPKTVKDKKLYILGDRRASKVIRDALSTAKTMLANGNMTVVTNDWPMMNSPTLGNVSALYHMVWGIEYAPGQLFYYSICSNTFSGQIAQWLQNYLKINKTTIADIVDDSRAVGVTHNPGSSPRTNNGKTGESQFRFCSVYQTLAPALWNMYFDMYSLDMIITPTQYTPTSTYADNTVGTIPTENKQSDGSFLEQPKGDTGTSTSIHFGFFKMLHIPKVVIPLGLDSSGKPYSFTVWGRAMPEEQMFCDSCSQSFDLEFLYKVKRVVGILHAPGSPLVRVDSTMAKSDVFK